MTTFEVLVLQSLLCTQHALSKQKQEQEGTDDSKEPPDSGWEDDIAPTS